MTSVHLPVLITVLPLATALFIPLVPRRLTTRVAGTASVAVLTFGSVAAVVSLFGVLGQGGFRYTFGDWTAAIGVEFAVTHFSAVVALLVTVVTLLVLVYTLRDRGPDVQPGVTGSFYMLVLVNAAAMLGIAYTNDLFNLYVFMEMLSIASCAIVTINGKRDNLYAGLKYLIIGTVGAITILFGMAILYMLTGHLNMSINGGLMAAVWTEHPVALRLALVLILVGFAIKAAVFPMHTWLPDAHTVAPAPSSAILSSLVVKIYLVGAMKILFVVVGVEVLNQTNIFFVLTWVGMIAMVSGSVLALGQQKVKRILACSTVVNVGYIVLAVGIATEAAVSVAIFHLVSHALLKAGLFLSVGAVIHRTGKQYVHEFAGAGYNMPLTMTVFTICALGMVGIPGTNGFMSKWYLILAAAGADRPIVLPVVLLSSFLNSLYFIPIVTRAFIQRSRSEDHIMRKDNLPLSTSLPLVTIALLVVVTGLYPELIMPTIRQAAGFLLAGGTL